MLFSGSIKSFPPSAIPAKYSVMDEVEMTTECGQMDEFTKRRTLQKVKVKEHSGSKFRKLSQGVQKSVVNLVNICVSV